MSKVYLCILLFSLLVIGGFWIVSSMLVTMFYASMIKASLTIPSFTEPMNNLRQIVDSNLPFSMVNVDPIEVDFWSTSPDQFIR